MRRRARVRLTCGATSKFNVCDDDDRFSERVLVEMTHQRMFAVARRQLSFVVRQLLNLFIVVVASASPVVDAASTASAVAGPFHIVAVFPAVNFSDWTEAFQEAVAQNGATLREPGVALSAAGGLRSAVANVCAAVERHNVSAMIVVGDQRVINSVLVVARHLSVPLLGYNIERRSATSPVSLLSPSSLSLKLSAQLK